MERTSARSAHLSPATRASVIEQEVHRDPAGEHLLMVVKLNADKLDEISHEIINLTFPEDITVYVYGRRPSTETA